MKIYLIFTGIAYETQGGFMDFTNDTDILKDAIKEADDHAKKCPDQYWAHVVDITTGKIIHIHSV